MARGRLRVTCLRPTLILRPEKEKAVLAQLALADPDRPPPAGCKVAGQQPYGRLSAIRTYVRSTDAATAFVLALNEVRDLRPFGSINWRRAMALAARRPWPG